jgi:nucleotide-binding universal stress UspA family protein
MFKTVLICHDGSAAGLRALKRGAELATLMSPKVHVLSFHSLVQSKAFMAASAVGQHCIVDLDTEQRASLEKCIAWLSSKGISAEGHIGGGETIDEIAAYAKRLAVDLIVIGHYPSSGRRWWSGASREALSDRVTCCVFIATDEVPTAAGPVPASVAQKI